jgi:hypothetical protein
MHRMLGADARIARAALRMAAIITEPETCRELRDVAHATPRRRLPTCRRAGDGVPPTGEGHVVTGHRVWSFRLIGRASSSCTHSSYSIAQVRSALHASHQGASWAGMAVWQCVAGGFSAIETPVTFVTVKCHLKKSIKSTLSRLSPCHLRGRTLYMFFSPPIWCTPLIVFLTTSFFLGDKGDVSDSAAAPFCHRMNLSPGRTVTACLKIKGAGALLPDLQAFFFASRWVLAALCSNVFPA